MNFASDNTAGAHPEILAAMARANEGHQPSYGVDRWSSEMTAALSKWFGAEVQVFPVATGGAANALALSQLSPNWGAVFCLAGSHIDVDECGAPEFYTGGAKLVPLGRSGGLMTPEDLNETLKRFPRGVVHHVQPSAVSITNANECGLVYRPDQVKALAEITHGAGMKFHMDGARLANALATLGCTPGELTWQAGVDVLSLGFTKNGAVAAEAVVFFDKALAENFLYRRKRGGHLFSKSRFLAAQFVAMLEDGLWLRSAKAANGAAGALAAAFTAAGFPPAYPTEANEVFVRLPKALGDRLSAAGAAFYPWEDEAGETPMYRFVCSFATTAGEVETFKDCLKL
ncbi:Low specificity L-threonine aldolase [Alphaproteobacteria bacterium SO-S41]|nr:Low specificity L-threonine aldolase [Alphaproteobacteria bacterium SO-S41]